MFLSHARAGRAILLAGFSSLALSGASRAQTISTLLLEGDLIPGYDAMTECRAAVVNSSGQWVAHVDTLPFFDDEVIVRDGLPLIGEGELVGAPAGATLFIIDGFGLDDEGQALFNHTLTDISSLFNEAVYVDGNLALLETDPVGAPQVGAGTTFGNFFDVKVAKDRYAVVRGFYRDPSIAGATEDFVMRLELDDTGAIVAQHVVAHEGLVPPGVGLAINRIELDPHEAAVNACGDVLWVADLDAADLPDDGVVYLNDTLLAREGAATGFGGTWGTLSSVSLDLNNAGDWALRTNLADARPVLVSNGQLAWADGDTPNAIAPFAIENFSSAPVFVDDAGRLLWYANWDDPDLTRDEGLFLGDRLMVQEGVTLIGGQRLVALENNDDAFHLSANGRFLIFRGELEGGLAGLFLMDLSVGTHYCPPSVNSTGHAASIHAIGTRSVAANNLILHADDLPPFQPGLFYFGNAQAQAPFGNGFRCVSASGGSQLYRLPTTAANKAGFITWELDNLAQPSVGQIVPGSTWNFQCWYRDPFGGGAFFDLTDAISVDFVP